MTNLKLKKVSKRNRLVYFDDIPRGVIPALKLPRLPLELDEFGYLETEIEPSMQSKIAKAIDEHAWNRILDWLAKQEHSSHECLQYLRKIYIPDNVSHDFIEKLQRLNFVNDDRFAEMLIESYVYRNKSRMEIKNKLYEKTLDIGRSEKWLNQFYQDKYEQESLQINLDNLMQRNFKLPEKKKIEKVISNLTRRGFQYQMIKDKLDIMEEEL